MSPENHGATRRESSLDGARPQFFLWAKALYQEVRTRSQSVGFTGCADKGGIGWRWRRGGGDFGSKPNKTPGNAERMLDLLRAAAPSWWARITRSRIKKDRKIKALCLRQCHALRGPVAQWIRHRPTEPGIAGSSPAGVILLRSSTTFMRAAGRPDQLSQSDSEGI